MKAWNSSKLIFIITWERGILLGAPFVSRAILRNSLLHGNLAMLKRCPFSMCGNPTKVHSRKDSRQLFFPLHLSNTILITFSDLSRLILKKAWKITKEVLNSLEIFYSKEHSWVKFNEKQGGFLIKFQDLEMGHIKRGVFWLTSN